MRRKAKKAKEIPTALNVFLQKDLNVWTQSDIKWVNLDHWLECGKVVDSDGLKGRICYGGLDLSSNIDISAFILVFPPQKEGDDYQRLVLGEPSSTVPVLFAKDTLPF